MVVRKSGEHLRCSLGVTNVRNLVLFGHLSDIVDLSWRIVFTKLKETVIKELSVIFLR